MSDLPDECDFCDQQLDDGEELVPIWIGEPAEPDTEMSQDVVEKPKADGNRLGGMEPRILNKPASEWLALWGALETSECIEVNTADRVLEPPEPKVSPQAVIDSTQESFDEHVNRDKAGATVKVKPPKGHSEPDLEVCQFCSESLRSEQ